MTTAVGTARDYEAQPRNVRECLVWLMKNITEIDKGRQAPDVVGGYSFRGIDQVLNAVGPKLREVGLVVLPEVTNIHSEVSSAIVQGASKKPVRFVTVTINFTLLAPNGDKETICIVGEAGDTGDKAVSKATSVATRIMWITLLMIPTGEKDPDEAGYERTAAAPTTDDPVARNKLEKRIHDAKNQATLKTAWDAVVKANEQDGQITDDARRELNELTKARLAEIEGGQQG